MNKQIEIMHAWHEFAKCDIIKQLWKDNAFKAIVSQTMSIEDITCRECLTNLIQHLQNKIKDL